MKPIQKQILVLTTILIFELLGIQFINSKEIMSTINNKYIEFVIMINVIYTTAITFVLWLIVLVGKYRYYTFYEFFIDYVKLIVYFGIVINLSHFVIYLLIMSQQYDIIFYVISFIILIIAAIVFMVKRK